MPHRGAAGKRLTGSGAIPLGAFTSTHNTRLFTSMKILEPVYARMVRIPVSNSAKHGATGQNGGRGQPLG